MKLIIGLGNPGAEHARNRHNVGFMAVDAIAEAHGFGPWRKKFQGQISEGRLDGEKCLLLKPSTYMNESGRAAAEAIRFYKLDLDDVVVLYDEIDLAPAKVRVKAGGGVAGHNGLKSLTSHIGNDYLRVRIGIGHPGHKSKVHSHVLKDFSKAERAWLDPLIEAIASSAPLLAEGDAANFMNRLALAVSGDEKPATRKNDTPNSRKAPSQRDLARKAADAPVEKQGAETGPFARLRKLFGAQEG
ncbi:MAG: aminoacyl-tRNA hydrolase [Hyphomicrobiaceae bacterium]|nr:aminoacyl-tRNA hydrolase [Hyphomicrobiaceae bacterium]